MIHEQILKIIFFFEICCSHIFLAAERSTSSLGGNQVDGLPPFSSLEPNSSDFLGNKAFGDPSDLQ